MTMTANGSPPSGVTAPALAGARRCRRLLAHEILRLWHLLVRGVAGAQRQRLDDLLKPVKNSRQYLLERLRKGPVRVSAPALVKGGVHCINAMSKHGSWVGATVWLNGQHFS